MIKKQQFLYLVLGRLVVLVQLYGLLKVRFGVVPLVKAEVGFASAEPGFRIIQTFFNNLKERTRLLRSKKPWEEGNFDFHMDLRFYWFLLC